MTILDARFWMSGKFFYSPISEDGQARRGIVGVQCRDPALVSVFQESLPTTAGSALSVPRRPCRRPARHTHGRLRWWRCRSSLACGEKKGAQSRAPREHRPDEHYEPSLFVHQRRVGNQRGLLKRPAPESQQSHKLTHPGKPQVFASCQQTGTERLQAATGTPLRLACHFSRLNAGGGTNPRSRYSWAITSIGSALGNDHSAAL
jgi:hypothetical protein